MKITAKYTSYQEEGKFYEIEFKDENKRGFLIWIAGHLSNSQLAEELEKQLQWVMNQLKNPTFGDDNENN